MKKLIIILVMLVPIILLAQVQPVPSTVGLKSTQQYNQSSGERSTAPGLLVWSQPPDCTSNLWASQLDNVYPFDAKIADDFLFASSPGQITAVKWWIGWFNGAYVAPGSFNIFIYVDNNCIPGAQVASWNIPFANSNEDAGCLTLWDSREYWATISPAFIPVPGQHYWIVIQPVENFPPQTGLPASLTQNLCAARQDFPFLGYYWTTIDTFDTAFELYAGGPSPTPISNWVFLLSGLLIAGAIFFRYRRSM
jgi:hypothetical protein